MKRYLFLFPLAAIVLFSCEKEIDFINSGGGAGGGTSGQKLVRVGTRSGTDTFTTDYVYNAAGKLVREYTAGTASGTSFTAERKFIRNASSGIITQVILKSNQLVLLGLDSVVTNIKYNTAQSKYSGTTSSISVFGFTILDSTIFTYDASGKLTRQESFQDNGISGGYQPNDRTDYTYLASGNVVTQKQFTYDAAASMYELTLEFTMEYDSKVSPVQLGADAVAIGDVSLAASNNVTKNTMVDVTDPANNQTTTAAYTYNSANKPVTSSSLISPLGRTDVSTYTYQ